MNARKAIAFTALMIAAALSVAAPAHAQSSPDKHKDAAAEAAEPAKLVDPNLAAVAIEIRETPHFNAITVTPIHKSPNSKALIRIVLENLDGIDDLRAAVRANGDIMQVLNARNIPVTDVVAATTDRNNDIVVFTKN